MTDQRTSRTDLRGKRVVVVGAARSGVAAAHLLAERGARVVLADVRPEIPGRDSLEAAGVAIETGEHRASTFAGAELVVLSPGVPPRQPALEAARAAGVAVIGEIELASWFLQGRIVAITGTKGKSTTTTLVGRMLEAGGFDALVGGNIGVPLSGQVARSSPRVVHVIEASSFQLETTATFHPWIAVFLNFSPDHLDRHASVAEYAAAKARIFERQGADDYAVVNAEDPHVMEAARRGRARVVPFAVGNAVTGGVGIGDGSVCWFAEDGRRVSLVPLSSVRLIGRHLLADVLAAAAVAHLAGAAPEAIRRAVEGFTGLEHALEPVGEIGGVRFVNDSKATNVEAASRAIESFPPGLVVIMGGRFKGGDLRLLRGPLSQRNARIVAIGEAAPLLREALGDVADVQDAPGMGPAVEAAWRAAPEGGTVLLAPACASFDMFRDYAERGRAFKEAVARLLESAPRRA